MGRATAAILKRRPKIATNQGVEVVPSVAPMIIADRLREGDQSRADEADDGEDGCGGGLNHRREERTGSDRAEAAGDEPLERAAQRVAREALQAFGEVVDSEQEQAEPTQERYGGGGIHGLRLLC